MEGMSKARRQNVLGPALFPGLSTRPWGLHFRARSSP